MARTAFKQAHCIDVRYSKFYAALTILISVVFLSLAIDDIISLKGEFFQNASFIFPSLYILVGSLMLYSGLFLRTRVYLRFDKENKTLQVYGTIGPWSRKYPFDFMYYANEKFMIEHGGKKKKIHFMKYTCDKSDLNILLKELSAFNKGK